MVWNWACFDHPSRISLFLFSLKHYLRDWRRLSELLLFVIIEIDGDHLFSYRTVKLEWLNLNMWSMWILKYEWLYLFILLVLHVFWAWMRSNGPFFILDRMPIIINLWGNIRRSRKHALFCGFLRLFCQKTTLLMVGSALFSDSQPTCMTPKNKTTFLLNGSESIDTSQASCLMSN